MGNPLRSKINILCNHKNYYTCNCCLWNWRFSGLDFLMMIRITCTHILNDNTRISCILSAECCWSWEGHSDMDGWSFLHKPNDNCISKLMVVHWWSKKLAPLHEHSRLIILSRKTKLRNFHKLLRSLRLERLKKLTVTLVTLQGAF